MIRVDRLIWDNGFSKFDLSAYAVKTNFLKAPYFEDRSLTVTIEDNGDLEVCGIQKIKAKFGTDTFIGNVIKNEVLCLIPWSSEAIEASHYIDYIDTISIFDFIRFESESFKSQIWDLYHSSDILNSYDARLDKECKGVFSIGSEVAFVQAYAVNVGKCVIDKHDRFSASNIVDYIIRGGRNVVWLKDNTCAVLRTKKVTLSDDVHYVSLFRYEPKFVKVMLACSG